MTEAFPFTAIVGMEQAKRSLICHGIDPRLGGVILLGHRGCAKSTLARSFAQALPPQEQGDSISFVEVPLGTTDDRLLGSVDTSSLMEKGEWAHRRGLIQQAHQGVLYIDEINLLPDHLSDSILDSAASGKHRIERDGISDIVDARYILIGSMNPEEGDLRPQLMDRFAHGIQVRDNFSVEERMRIVEYRMAFDDDPQQFVQEQQPQLAQFQSKLLEARALLKSVQISQELRRSVAEYAKDLKLEGMRPELAVLRTARCLAAWDGLSQVQEKHLQEAWVLCLAHRRPDALVPPPPSSKEPPPQEYLKPQRPPKQQTSFAPTQAYVQNVTLDLATPIQHGPLREWWKTSEALKNQKFQISQNVAQKIIDHPPALPKICWTNSFLTSLKYGWQPGQTGWRLKFKQPRRRPNVWIFIDASRSTGALRFLSVARNALLTLSDFTKTSRFHILLLKNSESTWYLKRGTAGNLKTQLSNLNEAGGKSTLVQALQLLLRSIQRQSVMEKDKLLICTDGLISPEAGQTAQQAKNKMRKTLQELSNLGIPFLWLHPTPKRGMSHWIPKLTDNLPITTIVLETKTQGYY